MFDIVDESKSKPTTFGDLRNGQFFRDADDLLVLKTDAVEDGNAFVFAGNGMSYEYSDCDDVVLVEVQMLVRIAGTDAGGAR